MCVLLGLKLVFSLVSSLFQTQRDSDCRTVGHTTRNEFSRTKVLTSQIRLPDLFSLFFQKLILFIHNIQSPEFSEVIESETESLKIENLESEERFFSEFSGIYREFFRLKKNF